MLEPKVLNPNGEWLLNSGAFPIYDPDSQVTVPAGVPVKATYTDWLKGQPTVGPTANPWPASIKEGGKAGALRVA